MSSTPIPPWIRDLGDLTRSGCERRVHRWLESLSRPKETSVSDELRQRLNHRLELLRDEITEARRAGLSWSTIGAMVGLAPDSVRALHAE